MNRVKELCVRRDIKQKELAAAIGVSQPTVSDWFNNKTDPSGKRLEKLSKHLNVSAAVILGYDEDPLAPVLAVDVIAERLTKLRDAKGATQEEVAEACGMSRVTLARYENGARKPIPENLSRLAEYYDKTVDYLLGRDTDINEKPLSTMDFDDEDELDAEMKRVFSSAPDNIKRASLDFIKFQLRNENK